MSVFYRIKCKCGNEQIVFSNISSKVTCKSCGEIIAENRGGMAVIHGTIVAELE